MDKKSQTTPSATQDTGALDRAVLELNNPPVLDDAKRQLTDTSKGTRDPQGNPSKLKLDKLDPEQEAVFNALSDAGVIQLMGNQAKTTPGGQQVFRQMISKMKAGDALNADKYQAMLRTFENNPEIKALSNEAQRAAYQLYQTSGLKSLFERTKMEVERQNRQNRGRQNLPVAAFNLKQYKSAQISTQTDVDDFVQPPSQEEVECSKWVNERIDKILAFRADEGIGIQSYEEVKRDVLNRVSPNEEEEANSVLQRIRQMDPVLERDQAIDELRHFYKNYISPNARNGANNMAEPINETPINPGNPVAAATEKKPWSLDLSGQVTNNMEKTAACQFGQEYVLYGPSEKRICPKLRGKQSNGGDVVSEYICRHHCLDGVVIDDNKTICGEALWRANVMDKYSREYVNQDGDIVGGYLNKRFEINRNVPEENKMRLKPGELRKPRPAEWGNLESRMQAMRQKEAAERGYRPDSNTGDPFVWDKDVDQNNVEQTQAERDRREEASGHELVQYSKRSTDTNKDQQENKPKLAFNLKMHKEAGTKEVNKPKEPQAPHCMQCGGEMSSDGDFCSDGCASEYYHKQPEEKKNKKAFNLQEYKTAIFHDPTQPKPVDDETKALPLINDDGIADGGEPYTEDEMDLMEGPSSDPQEEDIVWSDKLNGYVIVGGRGEIIAKTDWQLAEYLARSNFRPDVWWESDHGNYHPISERIYPLVEKAERIVKLKQPKSLDSSDVSKPMLTETAEASNIPVPDDGRSPDSNWDKREYTNNAVRTPQPFRRAFNLKEHKQASAEDAATAADPKKKRVDASRVVTAEPFAQAITPPRLRQDTTQVFNIPTETLNGLFNGDPEQFEMFWDTLDPTEQSIIERHPNKLAEIYQSRQEDINESAKALSMDD